MSSSNDLHYLENYFTNITPSIFCGLYSMFYIDENKDVFSLGDNSNYNIGHNDSTITVPSKISSLTNIKQISLGDSHTVCLNHDGVVFSFGSNELGQLGNDELERVFDPQEVKLPYISQVHCGDNFTVCQTDDGFLYFFGDNMNGIIDKSLTKVTKPTQISGISNVEYVTGGDYHIICKTYDNEFYSWGKNSSGQLGLGTTCAKINVPTKCNDWPSDIVSIECGEQFSLILTLKGEVYAFGNNDYSQLGINPSKVKYSSTPILVPDLPEIIRIGCGFNYCICLDCNNYYWAFGRNYFGQLGLGDTIDKEKPIKNDQVNNIIDICVGANQTYFKTKENKILTCGYNKNNLLGLENITDSVKVPTRVFENNSTMWPAYLGKSRQKSARK